LEVIERTIRDTRKNLSSLTSERDKAKQSLDEKSIIHQEISTKLAETKKNFGANSEKLKEMDDVLNKLSRQMLKINSKSKAMTVRQKLVDDNLKVLEDRRTNFELTLKDLQEHLQELQRIQKEEQDSLINVTNTLEGNLKRKDSIIADMNDAEKTARMAGEAVIEFQVQKSFVERMASEDNALERIEEMGETGAIPGILGRLENLIKVNPRYQRVIEVVSAGWLKAVVVRDVEVALKCVESLKKMKLGRIKLIPLREVGDITAVEPPNIDGVIGSASNFVRCGNRYLPAVNFVFGDTIVTSGEKSAFLTSKAGYRAIDVNGDLYEAGGGIESGYYRAPIEISSLLVSEKAIEGLSQSVQSLELVLSKRKGDISVTEAEISRLGEERIRRSDSITNMDRDVGLINQNIERAKQNVTILHKKIGSFRKYLENGNMLQSNMQLERERYRKHMLDLVSQRKSAKLQVKPAMLIKYETDESQLNTELNELNRQFVKIESDVNFLATNLETTFVPELERARIDFRNLDRQISALQEKVSESQLSLGEASKQLSELELSKESLSAALSSVKDRRKDFEGQLDKIDWELRKLEQEYDPLTNETHRLELEVQTKNSDVDRLKEELHALGFETPVTFTLEEVRIAESSLNLLRFELEKLGSVNQLAVVQYDEQQTNYKQLSVRLNQLESERKSIVDFMEEIERKKRSAFMQAYDKINESFAKFFSKLTGGGEGYLNLQNKEDPFAAGIDVFVQFPGKASRLIAAASGGEKSVTAVSFIFSIQNLSPAPFYMFDEVDAHLDPFNSERLADLLKDQSIASQFIVVTLRDVIMDRSDRLFGVYIQEGASKIVSTRLAEVVA
ncbi:MAG: chromosome segregation protein, partial [Thermoproteota archaeon]|nr:chromosome segregation protein [Thermoproteota archaeon]